MVTLDFKDCFSADDITQRVREGIEYLQSELYKLEGNKQERFETIEDCFRRLDATPPIEFIPTGVAWLDQGLSRNGLAKGSFINVAGQSFAGKTMFILEVLKKFSLVHPTAFFSYEMYEKLVYHKLRYSTTAFRKNCTIIQDEPYLDTIERRIRHLIKERGVRLVAIDSRMKIQTRDKMDDYIKNITISATLSRICRETGVIIMLINQMNEADLKSGRFSLKGGNDQVYDSDMIFYLVYDNKTDTRTLFCEKDRLTDSGKKWHTPIPNFLKKAHGTDDVVEFNEEIA